MSMSVSVGFLIQLRSLPMSGYAPPQYAASKAGWHRSAVPWVLLISRSWLIWSYSVRKKWESNGEHDHQQWVFFSGLRLFFSDIVMFLGLCIPVTCSQALRGTRNGLPWRLCVRILSAGRVVWGKMGWVYIDGFTPLLSTYSWWCNLENDEFFFLSPICWEWVCLKASQPQKSMTILIFPL